MASNDPSIYWCRNRRRRFSRPAWQRDCARPAIRGTGDVRADGRTRRSPSCAAVLCDGHRNSEPSSAILGSGYLAAGCNGYVRQFWLPQLPKDGNTLVFRVQFADGADLGSWNSFSASRLAALEAIADGLPASATRIRISNAIGSVPLSEDCLKEFASKEGADGRIRLLRLLSVTDVERKALTGSH